jgi:hypothetical protein
VSGSVGSIASGGITTGSFAAGAINAAAIGTGAVDADALATDAVDEIVDQVWNEARSGHTTGGSFGEGVASVQGNVTGSVASVGGNVGGNVTGSVGSVASGGITAASIATGAIDADALAADAGTELATAVWAAGTRELSSGNNIVLAKGTGVTGFNDLSAAQVNAEVVDAVGVDTLSQLTQAAPTATPTMRTALMQLYMWNRNKTTETTSQASLYDDAGTTVLQKAAISDVASVFTKDEIASGP